MRSFNYNTKEKEGIVTFTPHLQVPDVLAAYWLRQVTLRLRREVCWRMHEPAAAADKVTESLGMQRYWEEKKKFFLTDPTAKYLTDQLQSPPVKENESDPPVRGSFGWVIRQLGLDDTAAFVLALGLIVVFDSAVGSVISACLNDPMKTQPTFSLAQKLWDYPEKVMQVADPAHPLFRFGLLHLLAQGPVLDSFINWESPIFVPSLVGHQLLFPGASLPRALTRLEPGEDNVDDLVFHRRQASSLLHSIDRDSLCIIPIMGKKGAAHLETVRCVARITGLEMAECKKVPDLLESGSFLKMLATFCWLRDLDLYLGQEIMSVLSAAYSGEQQRHATYWLSLQSIPITIFISITEKGQLKGIPSHLLLPGIPVPEFSFHERAALWKRLLGAKAKGLETAIDECSRRFRYEKELIGKIAESINALPGTITAEDFTAACRAHLELDLGDLAQKVTPRFKDEMLILPHKQQVQFQEVAKAMKSLTEVHYNWGTARAWNESGISVLFAGPPGTGKTMAAEILARELDLPIYRIDLSQVVNKYIGETEKNLKRLFDAADVSDMILFFDEADSLFGRRTEVKDAHDRYANLEISYLLERMERFKGLAILATNRKKDLDEAFLRRLRYIVEFPFPEIEERKRIWRQVIPGTVDYSGVDINFLARKFQLTGGHIRSAVLNACLQCAALDGAARVLTMEQVVIAVKREYDKMERSVSPEHFGSFAGLIEKIEKNDEKH